MTEQAIEALLDQIARDTNHRTAVVDVSKLRNLLKQFTLVPNKPSEPAVVNATPVQIIPIVPSPPVGGQSLDSEAILYNFVKTFVEHTPATSATTQPAVVAPNPESDPVTVQPSTAATPASAMVPGKAAEPANGSVDTPVVVVTLNQDIGPRVVNYYMCMACCSQYEYQFDTPDAVVPAKAVVSPNPVPKPAQVNPHAGLPLTPPLAYKADLRRTKVRFNGIPSRSSNARKGGVDERADLRQTHSS